MLPEGWKWTSCTITLPYDKWVQLSAGAEAYLLFENEGGRGWTATSREYTHVPPSPALSRGRAR